jgi:hypothetical protein
VHFATWGNNPDWNVHTMSVRDRKLEMAHLAWSYIGPQPQPDFPLKQWVRFTAYIHYQGATGYIRVWQDGVPVLEGDYTQVAGTSLMRAHWGWYSSGSIDQGVQYNDEIQIWTLSEPLTDLTTEPPSPYTPDPPPGAGGSAGAASGGSAGAASGGSAGASGGSAGASSGGSAGSAGTASGTGGAGGTTSAGGAAGSSGATDSGEDDGGCGCRTRGDRGSGALVLLALGAVTWLLRRGARRHARAGR